MNRKGISTIIAVCAGILISMALAFLVGNYVKDASLLLSPEISCTELAINRPIEIKDACYDGEDVNIVISRSLNSGSLNSFSLKSDSEEWSCEKTCGTCSMLDAGETRNYQLSSENSPSKITLSIAGCTTQVIDVSTC